jgi:hypothetical protein
MRSTGVKSLQPVGPNRRLFPVPRRTPGASLGGRRLVPHAPNLPIRVFGLVPKGHRTIRNEFDERGTARTYAHRSPDMARRLRSIRSLLCAGRLVVSAKLVEAVRPICQSFNSREADRWPCVPAADRQAADVPDAFRQRSSCRVCGVSMRCNSSTSSPTPPATCSLSAPVAIDGRMRSTVSTSRC